MLHGSLGCLGMGTGTTITLERVPQFRGLAMTFFGNYGLSVLIYHFNMKCFKAKTFHSDVGICNTLYTSLLSSLVFAQSLHLLTIRGKAGPKSTS